MRASAHPELNSSRFGIRPLDRLLHLFQQHAVQPLQQSTAQPPKNRTPQKCPIIELTSLGPGQGKTHLLYLITALAVLPRHYDGIPLHGKASAVIILDTDNRFSVPRLARVAHHHITRCCGHHGAQPAAIATDALLAATLAHVHLLRPQSHAALLAALRALPAFLASRANPSSRRPLHSVLLDSASAFFWPLRAAADARRTASIGAQHPAASASAADAYAALAHELGALSARLDVAVVVTTVGASQRGGEVKPLLPAAFTNVATLRLVVAREAVRPFALRMIVGEARVERSQRQGVVEKGVFGVRVDGWGRGGWGRAVEEALEGGMGRWGLVVRGEGVWVLEDEEGEGDGGGGGGG